MKKLLSLILALTLVLSMSSVAFADEPETEYTDAENITFVKLYKAVGEGAVSPAETFEFENIKFEGATQTGVEYDEEWAEENLPNISTVSYEEGAATVAGAEGTITITLPEDYPSVGIYTYSFNEKDNNTEGVTYNNTKMILKVTVVEENGYKRVAAVHCEGEAKTGKTDEFDNTYSSGKLSVQKIVAGNMGDQDKEFEITVTFTANDGDVVKSDITYTDGDETEVTTIAAGAGWETKSVTILLNHEETITFNNIPAGVTYTVEETDLANAANEGATDTYVVTYTGESGSISANTTSSAVVTNTKGVEVDTGIILDNMPYILLLVVVCAGLFVFINKKRAMED